VLDPAEEIATTERFGVARDQVLRDHLISHLLAALSEHCRDQVVFFGGTALSRTFVPDGRLSEDIDLAATVDQRQGCGAGGTGDAGRHQRPSAIAQPHRLSRLARLVRPLLADEQAAHRSHLFHGFRRAHLAPRPRCADPSHVTATDALTIVRDAWKSASS
jgi:hypothetical protein